MLTVAWLSDILTEMPCSRSGVVDYEHCMPYPNLAVAQSYGFKENVLFTFAAQFYLRRQINHVQGWMYDPKTDGRMRRPRPLIGIKDIEAKLSLDFAGTNYAFRPEDPPSPDFLTARLRAKWWEGMVLIYRPFIRQVLMLSHNIATGENRPLHGDDGGGRVDMPIIENTARGLADIHSVALYYAQRGINALIECTRAYNRLRDRRYIVTNPFVTSHGYAPL